MTTSPVPSESDHLGGATAGQPSAPDPQNRAGSADDPPIESAEDAASAEDAEDAEDAEPESETESATDPSTGSVAGPHDVRSGGHAGQAPRSLTEAEAHWQEHESSGEAWDSRESI